MPINKSFALGRAVVSSAEELREQEAKNEIHDLESFLAKLIEALNKKRGEVLLSFENALENAIQSLDAALAIAKAEPKHLSKLSLLSPEEEKELRDSIKGFCPNKYVCHLRKRPQVLYIKKDSVAFDGMEYYSFDYVIHRYASGEEGIKIPLTEEDPKDWTSREILLMGQRGVDLLRRVSKELPDDAFYIVTL